jgi:hypothetical protein
MKFSARGIFVCGVLFVFPAIASATVNYGNFSGGPGTIGFVAVTETTATPGDPEPLFGPPIYTGDGLVFNPVEFVASAPVADTTSALLSFMIDVPQGMEFHNIIITEIGDYSLLGPQAAAQIATSVILSSDQGGTHIINTGSASSFFTVPQGQIGNSNLFTLSLNIPIGDYQGDIWFKMDNTLQAIAPDGSASFIQKKIVSIRTDDVPEPTSVAMLLLGIAGISRRTR